MKRILFSLTAGLLILSLAGCTLSLIATLTPSPTPLVSTPTAFTAPTETPHIPIPDTIVDEVGAPSEIKQFAGSAESLQPMIDAIANQLGFTPAEGELAGFTVTGAKGEGNYFFVSHEGTVYTVFAHAEGGRFATVKVDGASKTSDFAIFKMARFDRDAANVWWGIDDGQGGITQPMFEFQLNGDGSIAEVMFVEPKSGKSIQVSENTNQIQFESKALFKLQEPLGGSEVAYLWSINNTLLKSLPEGVTNILSNPSGPEVWQQPTGLFYSDGTPLPWGKFFVDTLGATRVNFSVLVRGVVEIPNPRVQEGGIIILPVFEVPAQGGSNFVIPLMAETLTETPTMNISYLTNGIPPTWESSLDHPVDSTVFYAGIKFTGVYNSRKIADVLQQYMGRIIIVTFSIDERDSSTPALTQVVQGNLIDQGGSHSVENFLFLGGLILPQK